jgi:TRAP-type mannitol/chloroaromatic compound transport system permease small subunit
MVSKLVIGQIQSLCQKNGHKVINRRLVMIAQLQRKAQVWEFLSIVLFWLPMFILMKYVKLHIKNQ